MANTIYTTPGYTQKRFENLLAKNYIGIGQIVGEELTNQNIKDKRQSYKQQGTDIVLFRYKVRLCSRINDALPNDQVIFAFGQNNGPSGKGGFFFGNWRYPDGEFVEVYQHPITGLFYIDNSVAVGVGVTLIQSRNGSQGCKPLSGYKPGSPTFQVSLANQGKQGGPPIGEISPPHSPDLCKWDDMWSNEPAVELKTPCEPMSAKAIPKAISGLLKDVKNLRTGLLGNDSFLVTSQNFVNKAQEKVNGVSSQITGFIQWMIQEMRKRIMRKVNKIANETVGKTFLNWRYEFYEKLDKANNAINCIFSAILDKIGSFVANALNNLINNIISPATCAIENFLAELLSQVANGILSALSGVLGAISGLIGQTIGVIDTVLSVVESIINLFDGCPPKQICPADEEWNILEGFGGTGNGGLDIQRIFDVVNSSINSVTGSVQSVFNLPTDFTNFDFGLDPNGLLNAPLSCFVGPSVCGPPLVRFFGGGAIQDAIGEAVVSPIGEVIGINILDSGYGYTSSPMIVIDDPCGIGVGARAYAEIGPVDVTSQDTDPGGGFIPRDVGDGPTTPGRNKLVGPPTGPGGEPPTGPGGTTTGPTTGPGGTTTSSPVGIGTTIIECVFPRSSGYDGPGIYLDLTSISSRVNVVFSIEINSSNTNHSITIPKIGTFDRTIGEEEQNSSIDGTRRIITTFSVEGGKIYGPCAFKGGTLHVGNTKVSNITKSGSLPDTCVVIEEGGDDWDDFILRTSRGRFVDLTDCVKKTQSVGVTTTIMLSTGFNYLSNPDGSRGANGLIYGGRCETLVQRSDGTWDREYKSGDVIRLETGDKVSLPGKQEILIGDSKLQEELTAIGAYIVSVNPPLATSRFRSMVGFDDSLGSEPKLRSMKGFDDSPGSATKPNQFGYENDYPAAKKLGYTDAEIRYYLENEYKGSIGPKMKEKLRDPNWGVIVRKPNQFGYENDYQAAKRQGFTDSEIRFFLEKNYTGKIGPKMRALLNDPKWGRIYEPLDSYKGLKSMEGFNDSPGSATKPNQFGYENDYPAAIKQGFTDADIRYYLENVYKGKIGPDMQKKLNDPNWGKYSDTSAGYYGIRQMFDFDDSRGGAGQFGYVNDYEEAKRQGYTDADIRYYLENVYKGKIGPRMQELLKDPNFGRYQGPRNMGGVAFGSIRDMKGFSDSYGTPGVFGNADYQEARRQGYTEADIRNYLENDYKGTIGARVRVLLNDPAFGKIRREGEFNDSVGLAPGKFFGQLDYEDAVRKGYSDYDVRYYLEKYYKGTIGPRMQARLADPNWGKNPPILPSPGGKPPSRIKDMRGFNDSPGATFRPNQFGYANDYPAARRLGFRDVDIRYFLENHYTGTIGPKMKEKLSDPNWGRLGQTITVSVTAPGCPEEPIVEPFISSTKDVIPTLVGARIADPGFEYNCSEDQIVVTPANGAEFEYECVNGSISDVRIRKVGIGYTTLPQITINTNTGYNAKIIPILEFRPVDIEQSGIGVTSIKIVDCVGRIPPRRQLDIVPE